MSFLNTPTILVPAEGDPNSKIAIVGEAPGADEVYHRRPFVGKSGRLLETLLGTAGISRNQCYFTNVVKERPVNNKIEQFIKFKKDIVKTPEYDKYASEFIEEIKKTNANVIVPTGNVSLYALLGFNPPKITSRRGSMYGIIIGDDPRTRKIIPIIHPASALREYMFRMYIMKDLQRIKKESLKPEVDVPIRNLHIFPMFDEVMMYLTELLKGGWKVVGHLAFDIESPKKTKEVTHISFSHTWSYAMSICFFCNGENFFTLNEEYAIWELVAKILGDKSLPKLAQNGSFDFSFLYRKYGIIVKNMDDTMIAQGIVHPDMKKDLGFIVSTRSREPYYKDDGGKFYSSVSSEENFSEYNAKDSAVLLDCWPSLESDIIRLGNKEVYEDTKRIIEPLVFMGQNGIRVDVEGRNKKRDEKIKEKEVLVEQLCQMIGYEINPDSPTQIMELFYDKKGIKPYLKKGKPTTDETALTRLSIRGYKEADIILDIRGLTASIPKYWDAKLVDGRLKCFYNPIGASDTGRLSSSKTIFDEGMNQQNQPHDVREFYIADEGYIMFELDYSQAEPRCVAYFAPEPTLIKGFEKGIDIHCQTAALIFEKHIDEISDDKGSTNIGGGKYSERDIGKHSNNGFNYDLTPPGFSLRWGIGLQQSQYIHSKYFFVYPGIADYHNYVKGELQSIRKLTNPLGRTRLFLDRMGVDLWREGYAYPPQSTVATQINRHALIPFYYNKEYEEVILLNQVHDSIAAQLPLSLGWRRIAEILQSMKRQMEQPITWRGTTFTIPIGCGMGWNLKDLEDVDIGATLETLTNQLTSNFDGRSKFAWQI